MAAFPLCLSLNKLHLFSLTKYKFILIQIIARYMCATCFGLYLDYPQAYRYKNLAN